MQQAVHQRLRKYACQPAEEMLRELGVSDRGLEQRQVAQQRRQYGDNRAQREEGGVGRCLQRAVVNPFTVVLLVLAVISGVTAMLLPQEYEKSFSTAAIILAMLVLSSAVRLVQELRARGLTHRLTRQEWNPVLVCRDGHWQRLDPAELVVGDLVTLEPGMRVPADLRVIQAQDLRLSQSVITGESGVLRKEASPLAEEPESIGGYANLAFQGSTVTGGSGRGVVLAVGSDTVYGALRTVEARRKQGFDRGANSIAWVLIRFMVVLVPAVFLVCWWSRGSWLEALLFALSVAVGLTPELLPMVTTACLARGGHEMNKKQTVVRNINAMQGFGSMDVLCVDKTGTLTADTVLLEYYLDVLGNESAQVLDYAYLNSCYHTGTQNHLDTAILRCRTMPGREGHFRDLEGAYPKVDELPFDYRRKYAAVLVRDGERQLEIIKGSVEEVAARCRYVQYRGQREAMGPEGLESIREVVEEMAQDGMKVLAVAVRHTEDTVLTGEESDFCLLGYLAFFDAPKQSAAQAIQKLRQLQVDVRVLTGDESRATISVCRRLGLDTDRILTGRQLEALDEQQLPVAVEQTRIFTQLTPGQKSRIVALLQANGHTVGYLGDGMNDLPAQLQADVGISVDTAASELKERADVVLLKKDLNVLEQGILEGRKAFANMNKYIKITASSNFGNILAVVAASLFLPFFPLTAVQLLLLNLFYDILCLVLPWDRVDQSLLTAPPEWTGRTLPRFMLRFGPVSSVFDVLSFAFLFFVLCPGVCGGSFHTLSAAAQLQFIALFQTGWLLESLWTQVLILYLLRTPGIPFVHSRPSPPVLAVTLAGIGVFTLLAATPLGALLGLTALPGIYYAFLAGTVLLYAAAVTAVKAGYCRRYGELL